MADVNIKHGKKIPKKLKKKKKTKIKNTKIKIKIKCVGGGGSIFSICSVWSLTHYHSWYSLPCIHQQFSIIATCYNHLLLLPHLISREENPSSNRLGRVDKSEGPSALQPTTEYCNYTAQIHIEFSNCCVKHTFVVSNIHLLCQTYICCVKHTFVVSNIHLLCQTYICCVKHTFVVSNIHLLCQTYICCVKHTFVVSNIHLLCQTYIYCVKHTFVGNKNTFIVTFNLITFWFMCLCPFSESLLQRWK